MKNRKRVLTLFVVLLAVFLAVLWTREQAYQARIDRLNAAVAKLEIKVHLLRVRARALQEEMEMLNLSAHMELMRKMESLKCR